MATHKSAAKRARQTPVRTARNTAVKSRVKSSIKAFRTALNAGDQSAAAKTFETAARELRKAGTKGALHKRTVSRRVSRLAAAQHHNKTQQATASK